MYTKQQILINSSKCTKECHFEKYIFYNEKYVSDIKISVISQSKFFLSEIKSYT